jgi:hypothetical protein
MCAAQGKQYLRKLVSTLGDAALRVTAQAKRKGTGTPTTNLPVCFSTPPVVRRSKNSIDVTEQERRSALTAPAAPEADHDTLPLLQRKCC